MEDGIKSTSPKPFVFVLMPFDDKLNDRYEFGIKGAAEAVGAYAERVDEQMFTEGILERIFNQINKADVIVADMAWRNENVFYEVGYAHALGKIVLLLTEDANDIPFDLKNKRHIVHSGNIKTIKSKLTKNLVWAINESGRKIKQNLMERLLVSLPEIEIPEANLSNNVPIIELTNDSESLDKFPIKIVNDYRKIILMFSIRNLSPEPINISLVYLLTSGIVGSTDELDYENLWELPLGLDNFESPEGLFKQFKLSHNIPLLPPEAVDELRVEIGYFEKKAIDELFKLRIYTSSGVFYDFPFRIKAELT